MTTITKAYAAGVDHAQGFKGLPNLDLDLLAPLSGEWAGESIPELTALYGVDLFDSDNADEFEDGFYGALSSGRK